ncbi:hypothetical protein WAJ71_22820, partial [Acinetobacter baumannii]
MTPFQPLKMPFDKHLQDLLFRSAEVDLSHRNVCGECFAPHSPEHLFFDHKPSTQTLECFSYSAHLC